MLLRLYKGNDCKSQNFIMCFGGNFSFTYDVQKKQISITTQTETVVYPCISIEDNYGNILYACTGE